MNSGVGAAGASADDWFAQQGAPSDGALTGSPSTPSGIPGPSSPQFNPQLYFEQLTAGKPGTPETLIGLEPQLNQAGIQVMRNASGVAGKIKLPNGQIIDVIRAAGAGGGQNNWQWLTGDGGGGAAGGIGVGLETSPGYQFRLGEGLKALERSAAARGTLLTGGTLKGLERYAQDYASNEYGNRVNQLMDLSRLGLAGAGGTSSVLQNQAAAMGNLVTDQGNARAAGTIGIGNAWNQGLGSAANAVQQYYLYNLLGGGGGSGGGGTGNLPFGTTYPVGKV